MADKVYKTFKAEGIAWLQKYIDPDDEVIDFGCGLMPITKKLKCKKLIAVDGWYPYVDRLRQSLSNEKHIFVWHLDLSGPLLSAARDRSIDVSLALDVVEHFEKEDAIELIKQMERISRKRVVIFTTDGFRPQERDENKKLQRHRCGFRPHEFDDMGYEVIKRIRGHVPSFLAVKELI